MNYIESAISTRLENEINKKKILCNKQIGFMRGCGNRIKFIKIKNRVVI